MRRASDMTGEFRLAPLSELVTVRRTRFDTLPAEATFKFQSMYDVGVREYVKVDEITAERMSDGLAICPPSDAMVVRT